MRRRYFYSMFENSKRYTEGKHAAAYLGTAALTLAAAADREGVPTGVLLVVVQVAALKASGAQASAADLARAELANASAQRANLAEAKRRGWLDASGDKLHVTSSGRQLVADVTRGWERAAKKLARFGSALPFRKRAARRQDDQA